MSKKKLKTILLVICSTIAITLMFLALYIIASPPITGCWNLDSNSHEVEKKRHLVFYDGKVFMQGGVQGCMGHYDPDEFTVFGSYELIKGRYIFHINDPKLSSEFKAGLLDAVFGDPPVSPPLVFKRNLNPGFNLKVFMIIDKDLKPHLQSIALMVLVLLFSSVTVSTLLKRHHLRGRLENNTIKENSVEVQNDNT